MADSEREFFGMPREFWDNKMRTMQVSGYFLSTLLEEIGRVALGASYIWHSWGEKRSQEIRRIGCELIEKTASKRREGWGWAGNDKGFGSGIGPTLIEHSQKRYHDWKDWEGCQPNPDAVSYMTSMTADFILAMLPFFASFEKKYWEQSKKWVSPLQNMIEDIMESPCLGNRPHIPSNTYNHLGNRAFLLECELLAETQAHIEWWFGYKRKPAKQEAYALTKKGAEKFLRAIGYQNISDEFMPCITEAKKRRGESLWHAVGVFFMKEAEKEKHTILNTLSLGEETKRALEKAWHSGMMTTAYSDISPCWSTQEIQQCEKLVKELIRTFSFAKDNWMEKFQDNNADARSITSPKTHSISQTE